jgi:transmembrane sensor
VNRTEIEKTAAAWFAKHESGDWSAVEQSKLEAWLESSTSHRIAYIRIVSAWERSGRLSALGAGVPSGAIPERNTWNFSPPPSAPSSLSPSGHLESAPDPEGNSATFRSNATWLRAASQGRARLRIAAALLILGSTAAVVWYFSWHGASSYRTSIGALSTIPLADGSKVTLNTNSQINVVFNNKVRSVKLDRGEAFFEVSKDPTRPFVVDIADKRVVAVGTRFSIRRDENDMRVYVEEGRVQIKRLGITAEATETQLPAGSEARTAKNSLLVDQPTPAQVEQLLSWRTGYIRFRDARLADAVVEFNRYTLHKIVIEDPAIADIHIGGNFRTDDADGFLGLLQSGFPVKVDRRGELIILTRR